MVTLHDGPIRGTLVTDLLSGRPCVRRVMLRVAEGKDEGAQIEVGELSVLVGSHPETDLTLSDPMISRQHLEVRLVDDGVEVRDLGSKNGTWTGDGRIDRTKGKMFGAADYAFEELVAETGAAILSVMLGVSPEPRADHAQYLNNWKKALTDNPKAVFSAFTQANKAVDFLYDKQPASEEAAA